MNEMAIVLITISLWIHLILVNHQVLLLILGLLPRCKDILSFSVVAVTLVRIGLHQGSCLR